MSLLQQDKYLLDITLGQIFRIPCKFIQGRSSAPLILLKNISQRLQVTGKNLLPVIVRHLGEDSYQAIQNIQVLESARFAKLDFVWCMVVDEQMQTQLQIESGHLLQVNILTSPEQEIVDALEYIRVHRPGFKTIKPQQVARAIVEYRKTKTPANLSFLTKQRCGIGKAKIAPLSEFLITA